MCASTVYAAYNVFRTTGRALNNIALFHERSFVAKAAFCSLLWNCFTPTPISSNGFLIFSLHTAARSRADTLSFLPALPLSLPDQTQINNQTLHAAATTLISRSRDSPDDDHHHHVNPFPILSSPQFSFERLWKFERQSNVSNSSFSKTFLICYCVTLLCKCYRSW